MLQVNVFKGTEAELKRRLLRFAKAKGMPHTCYLHTTLIPSIVLWSWVPLDSLTLDALQIQKTCRHYINPFLLVV